MSKYDGHTRARNLPQDVQRWAVEASDPGVKCMTKDELRRRRLEGYRMNAEQQKVFTVSSVDELETMFGVRGAGFKPMAYTDEGFRQVQDACQKAICDAMGVPARYLYPTEDAAADAFVAYMSIPTVLRRLDDCPMCGTTGELYGVECPACGGYGLVEESDADFKARMVNL